MNKWQFWQRPFFLRWWDFNDQVNQGDDFLGAEYRAGIKFPVAIKVHQENCKKKYFCLNEKKLLGWHFSGFDTLSHQLFRSFVLLSSAGLGSSGTKTLAVQEFIALLRKFSFVKEWTFVQPALLFIRKHFSYRVVLFFWNVEPRGFWMSLFIFCTFLWFGSAQEVEWRQSDQI